VKLKIKKILAATLGITLILLLLLFVNSWVGNPISKILAKNAAEQYIEKNYKDLNLEIQSANYNFKFGSYMVFCQSADSVDTAFSVYVDSFGNVVRDDYEYEVANNFATFRRLDNELRSIGDKLLRDHLKYNISNAGFLMDHLEEGEMEQLTKDMPLDVYNPPFKIGASITIIDPDVSYDKMAEVLKNMAEVCSNEGIPIAVYSVRIEYDNLVSVEDGAEARENLYLDLYNIPEQILQSDNLPKALEELASES